MAVNQTQQTRKGRWATYGVNVAVVVLVVVVIVLLLNGIAYRALGRLRYDTTHLRQYSLSDQTRQVLRNLDGEYRIVTVIARSNPQLQEALDLIDEYQYLSGKIQVEHVDPLSGRGAALFDELRQRFSGQLDPLRQAVEHGRQSLNDLRGKMSQHQPLVEEALADPNLRDREQAVFLSQLAGELQRFEVNAPTNDEQIARELERPMPRLSDLAAGLRETLLTADWNLEQSIGKFRQWAKSEAGDAGIKDRYLRLADAFVALRRDLAAYVLPLKNLPDVGSYDQLRGQIEQGDAVLILGPRPQDTRVLPVAEMFRVELWQEAEAASDQQIQRTFLGEEQITGALVSMDFKTRPMVVFVSDSQQRVIGAGGEFGQVSERLSAMNFDVREWNPVGRAPGPMQRPVREPLPVPDEGQKVVWVIAPLSGALPTAESGLAELLPHVEQGDSVLVMLMPRAEAAFGSTNPLTSLVQSWGIDPKEDRRLLRLVVLPGNQQAADFRMIVHDWPDDLPMTAALGELPGVFPYSCPLEMKPDAPQDLKLTPLATVKGQGLWAEVDLSKQQPKFDKETSRDSFLIAAAVEQGESRRIVIGDGVWASDRVTTSFDEGLQTPGLAPPLPAAFPANAELFVNSVYWLAGTEQLIGRSARVSATRPIGELGEVGGSAIVWGLLAGLPGLALVCGAGVWLRRRAA